MVVAVEPGDTTEGGDMLLRLCCLVVDGAGVVSALMRDFGPEDPADPVLVPNVALAPAPAFRKLLGVENEGGEGV